MKRTAVGGLLVAMVLVGVAACATTSDAPATPSLYKRLGGREGIAGVVDGFVANARPEKAPQQRRPAISSIACGARYARYFPGSSAFEGRLINASRSRASAIFRRNSALSQMKPARPDFTALSAR